MEHFMLLSGAHKHCKPVPRCVYIKAGTHWHYLWAPTLMCANLVSLAMKCTRMNFSMLILIYVLVLFIQCIHGDLC